VVAFANLYVYQYIFRDCLITAGVNSFTSIFSGFVVFTYLGYMASRQDKHIDTVAQEGKIWLLVFLDEKPYLTFLCYCVNVFVLTGSHILPSSVTVSICLSWREAISYLLVLLCQCVCLDGKPHITFLCYCVYSGFVVFTYLGYMASRQDKHIDTVAQEGKIWLLVKTNTLTQ
jgi:hypothetical protein